MTGSFRRPKFSATWPSGWAKSEFHHTFGLSRVKPAWLRHSNAWNDASPRRAVVMYFDCSIWLIETSAPASFHACWSTWAICRLVASGVVDNVIFGFWPPWAADHWLISCLALAGSYV